MGVRPGTPRHLRLTLFALLLVVSVVAGHPICDMDSCTRAYDVSLMSRGLQGPEGSAAFCQVLYDYGTCMYEIRSGCRGNLNYHTSNTMLIHLKTRFDCTSRLKEARGSPTGAPRRHPRPPTPPPPPASTTVSGVASPEGQEPAVQPQCSFHGRRVFRHCGLFGDPHLKTFEGTMQTCRVQGAWPLVDNPYLAVQVTNEHVLPGSPATATTKVTVIVKSSSTPCTPQKTYEATAADILPNSFIDGTNKSGPSEAVVLRHKETSFGAVVEIFIRYIETTVIVRKVGRYLAFSAQMPEELVSSYPEAGLQLCVKGCPLSERMDLATDRGHVLGWTEALERCVSSKSTASQPQREGSEDPSSDSEGAGLQVQETNEVVADLTDQYLDWCVFDLMTTGKEDFVLAARSAHRDTLAMDPGALRNRTTAQLGWDVGAGGGTGPMEGASVGSSIALRPAPSVLALAVLLLAVLAT